MKKLVIPILIFLIILCCCSIFLIFNKDITKTFEYYFQRIIMANTPTIQFECSEFGTKSELENLLNDNTSNELLYLSNYLKNIHNEKTNAISEFIQIVEVGDRCSDKYQFKVIFYSDSERVDIERILENQKLDNYPVFLHNL